MGAGVAGVVGVFGAALLAGCSVDLSGLNQILDPDPSYLKLPGRLVAPGEYSDVSVGGSNTEGAYLIATEHAEGKATLAVMPFEGGRKCTAGPTDRSSWQFFSDDEGRLALPFMRTSSGNAQVHLVNQHCAELLPPLASDSAFLEKMDPGYLVLERDGDLVLIQPWDGKQRTVARDVRGITKTSEVLWTLESTGDGAGTLNLVGRDKKFRVIGRIEDVQEFVITETGNYDESGFVTQSRIAYVQNGELHVTTSPDFESSAPIDTDVCGLALANWGISYLSPCGTRTLNLYGSPSTTLNDGEPADEQKYVLKDNVVGAPVYTTLQKVGASLSGTSPNRVVVLVASAEDADAAPENVTLWGGFVDGELERIGQAPLLDGFIQTSPSFLDGKINLIIDVANGAGRLVRWEPGSAVQELANGVSGCTPPVCLTHFDGETGDAVLVSDDGSVRPLASGVPRGGFGVGNAGMALLTDYDPRAGVGTLAVARDGENFERVATGVPISGYRFLEKLIGIAYLRDFQAKDGTGVLEVQVLKDTFDTFDTGIRASEVVELAWPQNGLLYTVPRGKNAGIWFAGVL